MTKANPWPTPIPVRRALQQFGADVAAWRKLGGLTAIQVADRAGVNVRTLRSLEQGTGTVSLENTLRIVRVLGLLDKIASSLDPYSTDVGRLRTYEQLPERVRPKRSRDA